MHLVINEEAHIPVWGTVVTTPVVEEGFARINVKTELTMPVGKNVSDYRIVTQIKNAEGKMLSSDDRPGDKLDGTFFNQNFVVYNPSLWSPDAPVLYTAETKIYEGEVLKDEYATRFGIRTIELIPDKGFFLNGKVTKFKGVCNHHDLGLWEE